MKKVLFYGRYVWYLSITHPLRAMDTISYMTLLASDVSHLTSALWG